MGQCKKILQICIVKEKRNQFVYSDSLVEFD